MTRGTAAPAAPLRHGRATSRCRASVTRPSLRGGVRPRTAMTRFPHRLLRFPATTASDKSRPGVGHRGRPWRRCVPLHGLQYGASSREPRRGAGRRGHMRPVPPSGIPLDPRRLSVRGSCDWLAPSTETVGPRRVHPGSGGAPPPPRCAGPQSQRVGTPELARLLRTLTEGDHHGCGAWHGEPSRAKPTRVRAGAFARNSTHKGGEPELAAPGGRNAQNLATRGRLSPSGGSTSNARLTKPSERGA